ncbi:FecR domain-containing protein [Aporhodopirellula aestuarii]|uniref:FecR domain-containing protein n=1 Tax=Aporhodopirellula aestuarii TaxID=2950107 RepID=A0ABT0U274_9BACT|nr:FecR domain-containing protein [Aporhodopirellula aestuarii]MCM2371000.1 FecR domain-containing protein [Aporhodopirellula aestuarii]
MMDDKRFQNLLIAYLEGEISDNELIELHASVTKSPDHRRRFQDETRMNVLLRETLVEHRELQSLTSTATNLVASQPQFMRPLVVAATAAALIGAISIGFFAYQSERPRSPVMGVCMSISGNSELLVRRSERDHRVTSGFQLHQHDEVICDSQTQAMLRLSDGSIVSMEPDAELKLGEDSTQVKLQQGEAFFEIAPRQSGMPAFEVLTGNSTVAVMGTVFSLVASKRTEIKVYEGSVTLTRNSDHAAVTVDSQQMVTSDDLTVQDLESPSIESERLLPTDDLTLDRGEREKKFQLLKVEGGRRVAYLRFMIPELNQIRSAKLRLTQAIDSGSGTLQFFVGDHSDWTEADLTQATAPIPTTEVARHRGIVARGQIVEVDVTDAIQEPGPLTIVVTLDKSGEDDIWFGARESETPPVLILNRLP